ncbi:MAG: hypothetical protein ABH823_05195 [bacterium]
MNLQPREKQLLVVTLAALVFLIYWYQILNPVLLSNVKLRQEIKESGSKLELLMHKPREATLGGGKFDVYPQEAQLNFILNFIDQKFKAHKLKLLASKHTFDNNKLTVNLVCESGYAGLTKFLADLAGIKTLLVIDEVVINQKENQVLTEMKLLSGYL